MRIRHIRTVTLVTLVALASAACSSDNSTSTASTSGPVTDQTSGGQTSVDGGADGGSQPSLAPVCDLVDPAELAALFPGATPNSPDVSTNSCTRTVSPPSGSGAFFAMMPVFTPYDERLQMATDLNHTISQLDGIGERSYYAAGASGFQFGEIVFEKGGVVYSVIADYALGDVVMPDAATIQDSLMRIAAAWAATL